ncbi:carotenoid oxygenase family protein [Nocardia takedensis]|uniref:carotenoid oxygenase family protein n=1 Tax=Nocardia takedensis TaxID=259390 RepID=UPI0002D72528|nr:carotenoid oxygenase family protein [Nocardia takedensis]
MAAPTAPAPVDLTGHTHLTGVFAPQRREVEVDDLPIVGELPADLRGTYFRNGPNPRFDPIGSYVYPLDGDAMVHRLRLEGGRAAYTNRFVRTPMVLAEERAGHALWAGITDPYTPGPEIVGPDLAGTSRQLPDINVVAHGGRLLAMAESDLPYRLDPADLATLAREDCDGAMALGSTAHPKLDPVTGDLVLFTYRLDAPYLAWSVVGPDGTARRAPTPVEGVDEPVMVHDMALTARYIVLFLCPLVFDIPGLLRGGSLLDWRPAAGTRIALIPRDGSAVRWAETDTFWVWHFANAYDEADGTVVVDYVQWAYPSGLAKVATPQRGALVRAVIDPRDGGITRTDLAVHPVEFPRVDDRELTGRHSVIATAGSSGPGAAKDALLFLDSVTGRETWWNAGDLAVGEPIFLPGERAGYWGTLATDRTDLSSWFHVLAAEDPGAGPIASVRLPIRVPAGLHGMWLPADSALLAPA